MADLSIYLPQLLLAWSIQLVGVISPGPSVALIMGVAVRDGRGAAVTTAFGVSCATIILALATAIGIAAIFAQMAELMTLVRIIGGAYLAYLAYKAFRTAILLPPLQLQTAPVARRKLVQAGFLLQVSNPKAIFFWLAVASAGGVGGAPLPIIALFVLGAFVNSFIGHAGYALLLSAPPFLAVYKSARRWVEATLGGVFAFASFKLLTERG